MCVCVQAHTKKNVWNKIDQNVNRMREQVTVIFILVFVICILTRTFVLLLQSGKTELVEMFFLEENLMRK